MVYKGLDRKAGKLASPFSLPAEHPSSFQGLKNVAVKLYKEIERDLVPGSLSVWHFGWFFDAPRTRMRLDPSRKAA